MYRSRLSTVSSAALSILILATSFACKSKTEKKPAAVEATKRSGQALLDVPQDVIYAASAHIRIIDVAAGQVAAGIDLQRAINGIVFTKNGLRGFVAASDGVHEIDPEKQRIKTKLTHFPARSIHLSADDSRLYVLEHEVVVLKSGARDIKPFRLLTIDLGKNQVLNREEIGQGIFAVLPAQAPNLFHLVVSDVRKIRLVAPGQKLSEGKTLDLTAGFESDRIFGMRPYLARSPDGRRAYLPVEGRPAQIAEVNLEDGSVSMIGLDKQYSLRGLAITPNGKTLVVNAGATALRIDLKSKKVSGQVSLEGHHLDVALSLDGRRAYFAKPVHEKGGAISIVLLETMKLQGLITTPDISPWVLTVRPRTAYASLER